MRFLLSNIGIAAMALSPLARAEDWPVYQHDNRRSGVTGESLEFPLHQAWLYESPIPPQTAWTGPAKWDAYSGNDGLQSMRNFDPAFYVTTEGDLVYFGSSVDDAVHCYDANSGQEKWVFFTGSAVRLPPSIADGKAYFGSDDGFVYCTDALTGKLVWKQRAAPSGRLIPSNGKMISPWPVRTGILIQEGKAFFAASLLPWRSSFLYSVSAANGQRDGDGHFRQEQKGVTLQGALLASGSNLYAPQGRAAPLSYELTTGKPSGAIAGAGGVYCLLTEDEQLISGPQNQKSPEQVVRLSNAKTRRKLATFSGTNRVLVGGRVAYLHQNKNLKALDRRKFAELQREREAVARKKKKSKADNERLSQLASEITACTLWSRRHPLPIGFVLAGSTLFIGLENGVAAVDSENGKELWRTDVVGKCYGLAVANGRLFVSTDRGRIYCFTDS